MISKIVKNEKGAYVCSYCRMRIFDLSKANCQFCGNYFSNKEDIMIKQFEEEQKNESNLSTRN